MSKWQRTLRLGDDFQSYRDGEITVQVLAGLVAKHLKRLTPFPGDDADRINDTRDDLVDEFEALAGDETADIEEFDDVLSRLYDWGDTRLDAAWSGKKVCWVDTITRTKVQA